jgi:hypothetical protein
MERLAIKILIKSEDAISMLGEGDNSSTKTEVAKKLGVSKQYVSSWGEYVPQPIAQLIAFKYPEIPREVHWMDKNGDITVEVLDNN